MRQNLENIANIHARLYRLRLISRSVCCVSHLNSSQGEDYTVAHALPEKVPMQNYSIIVIPTEAQAKPSAVEEPRVSLAQAS
jgi:hypothetical protein